MPSERRHSVPSLTRKATPFVSTTFLNLEDDQSTSLERLITELILLESENGCSRNPSNSNADVQCSTWSSLPATAKQERDVEKPSLIAEELFEGLIVCPTSDSDFFSSLELESIYSGDCAELLALQDAPRFQESIEGFNVVIKSDPEQAESPSPPDSAWNQKCFSFSVNGFSRQTHNEQVQNGINGKADAEASVLEGALQSKLFLDSPPFYSESAKKCTTRSDQTIIDHDYCQTDDLSPTDGPQDCNMEPVWISKRRKHSKCCLSRGVSDYSALKSLLLDSNLTEEVRKEAELDRAKSRKNMSEKRKSPVIAEPIRALRCGKGVYDDEILLSHLTEGDSPLRLLYKNLTELTGGQLSLKGLFEQLLSSDETSNPETEDGERNADTAERLSTVSGSPDPCQNPQAVAAEKREESGDIAIELSTPLTSHLDLCSGGDIENVIFFDSFEEFYSSSSTSSQELESTAELKVEEHSESSPQSSMTLCESSRLPTNNVNRWNFKKPSSSYHSLKKRTGGLVPRRDTSGTRGALRSGQLIRKQSTVAPLCCRVRSVRRKPIFVDKRNENHRPSASATLQTVE